jgi:GntR family transcriptional regulator, transcriptional repressor for pyruvate dehydrogenase complex
LSDDARPASYAESKRNHTSAVDIVINKIVDDVLTGKYKPGDKLPTEIQLADMVGMSKNTVREAIKILVAYGAVEIRRPEGTFIASSFSPRLLNPVIYSLLFSQANVQDLFGLRRMIDTGVCMLLIQQGLTPEDTEKLEAQNELYTSLVLAEEPDADAVNREDVRFHKMLAAATHNELVRVFHDYVTDLTLESRNRVVHMCKADNNMKYLADVHRMTLDLVERKSSRSLEETIDYSYYYWKATFGS